MNRHYESQNAYLPTDLDYYISIPDVHAENTREIIEYHFERFLSSLEL